MGQPDPQTQGRAGLSTRSRIRETALRMFTEQGFEGTSTKDLADALGITKSSLYYYFPSKDAIVLSLLEERQHEIDALLAWVEAQDPGPDLAGRTALRWVEGLTEDAIQGMRFARANRPAMRRLGTAQPTTPFGFRRIIDALVAQDASDLERLRVMALFEAGSAVILAGGDFTVSNAETLQLAREIVQRLSAAGSDLTSSRKATAQDPPGDG